MAVTTVNELYNHTDVIRNFCTSNKRVALIDYLSQRDAFKACACMRTYLSEHYFTDVTIIQRGKDLIIYRPTR